MSDLAISKGEKPGLRLLLTVIFVAGLTALSAGLLQLTVNVVSRQLATVDLAISQSGDVSYLVRRTDFGHSMLQLQLIEFENQVGLENSKDTVAESRKAAQNTTKLLAAIREIAEPTENRLAVRRDGDAISRIIEDTGIGVQSPVGNRRRDAIAARIDQAFGCEPWTEANGEQRRDLTAVCFLARLIADASVLVDRYLVNDPEVGSTGPNQDLPEIPSDLVDTSFGNLVELRIGEMVRHLPEPLDRDSLDGLYTPEDRVVLDDARVASLLPVDAARDAVETTTSGRPAPEPRAVVESYRRLLAEAEASSNELLAQLALTHENRVDNAQGQANLLRAAVLGFMAILFLGGAAFVARRRRRLGRLENELFTDSLTGLRNRYWLERVASPVFRQRSRGGHIVLHVDIDRFKAINDTFGHAIGDRVLVQTAALCRAAIDRPDSVVRLGGDEFVIIVHDMIEPVSESRRIADRLRRSLREPMELQGRRVTVDVSIGITTKFGPSTMDALLLEADSALYEAKNTGRNRTIEYGDTNRPYIVRHLANAFARKEIRCELQPQIDLTHGNVGAVEVLARWYTTDGTVIPIPELIRTIESLGYTGRLFEIVVNAAADAAELLADHFDGRFWINISPLDLTSFDADERLLEVLAASGLPFNRIGVEVTETVQMVDLDHAARVLSNLRDHDIAVAIDDFGSGNTPLKHLTDLPLDLVKLDRSVISLIDRDPQSRVIVEAMSQVADALAVDLLAEGVERPAELQALRSLGVSHGQGYLFARPMTPHQLLDYLSDAERHRIRRSLIDMTDEPIG